MRDGRPSVSFHVPVGIDPSSNEQVEEAADVFRNPPVAENDPLDELVSESNAELAEVLPEGDLLAETFVDPTSAITGTTVGPADTLLEIDELENLLM